jgi:hypothetical protein
MDLELVPALTSGLIAGLLMLLVQVAGNAITHGSGFDVTAMWSRFLALEGQRSVGLVVHLAVSVAVAVVYALGFRLAGAGDTGWAWGLTGSIIHWIIAGSFLGTVPADGDVRPGPFGMNRGAPTAVGFLVGHLAFGLVVGLTYFGMHPDGGLDAAL